MNVCDCCRSDAAALVEAMEARLGARMQRLEDHVAALTTALNTLVARLGSQ